MMTFSERQLRVHEVSDARDIPWGISGSCGFRDGNAVCVIAKALQRGTASSRAKAADQTEPAKTPDSELTGSTWLTKDASGFFTFILVCVGGIQALFFWVQLRLIRESLADTKIAADAAERAARATENAVELSRKTAEQQLRAYLFPKAPRVLVFAQEKICFQEMRVMNYGQTPADDVVVIANTDFLDPNPVQFPEIDDPDEISKSTIAPTGEIVFTTSTEYALTADQIESVSSGRKAFFVWGEIRYKDAFGRPQITNFRLRFGNPQLSLGNGGMMICNEGNQAT